MPSVSTYIESQRDLYHERALLSLYRSDAAPWCGMPEARDWAFWIMAFQDVLQLIEQRIDDPDLRRTVGIHRMEDGGHDKWYFQDLETLRLPIGNGPELFGEVQRPARELSYRQFGRILAARTDVERLIILEVIEATSLSLFESTSQYVRRHGKDHELLFFSENHLNAERDHERRTEGENSMAIALDHTPSEPFEPFVRSCYGDFAAFIDALHSRHYA
jgi:hypothetical protein